MKQIILVAIMLVMFSCNPLRKMQMNERRDSLTVDKSVIQKSDKKSVTGETNFVQTVIEFYHPIQLADPFIPDKPLSSQKPVAEEKLPESLTISTLPIKRIIRTEVSSNTDISETADSVAKRDFQSGVVSEIAEKVAEKPPPSVISLRWIVIGIGCLLALFLVIKFRFFK